MPCLILYTGRYYDPNANLKKIKNKEISVSLHNKAFCLFTFAAYQKGIFRGAYKKYFRYPGHNWKYTRRESDTIRCCKIHSGIRHFHAATLKIKKDCDWP